jgi:hypothetical protein
MNNKRKMKKKKEKEKGCGWGRRASLDLTHSLMQELLTNDLCLCFPPPALP